MSIRNAIIARRKRKIGLFEQERVVPTDDQPMRRQGPSSVKNNRKSTAPSRTPAWAFWQEH